MTGFDPLEHDERVGGSPAAGPAMHSDSDRLGQLRHVSEVFLAADSPAAVARAALDAIRQWVPIVRGSVTEIDHERGETIVLAAVSDTPGGLTAGTRMPVRDMRLLEDYARGETRLTSDILDLDEHSDVERLLLEQGVRCYANVPLLADGELVGSLNLGSPHPGGLTGEDLSLACDLANLVAVAICQARLRDALRQRTAQLEDTVAELERVDAWRLGLVGMLAHDVRGPLATIVSTLELMDARIERMDANQARDLITGALRSARRILDLAADLLDLARSEHGQLTLARTRVMIPAAIEAVLSYLPDGAEVAVDVPPGLVGHVDPARLEQIITNLVTNALRHGEPPITVSARPRTDGGFRLTVEDRGEGVPQGDVEGLFGPFARGRRADSAGLGLWVVRELVRAHGGAVRYEQSDRGGARFVADLPGETPPPGGPSTA